MALSKLDQAITVIRYRLKEKMKRVKEMEKRIDISENQKIFIAGEYELIRNVETLINAVKTEFNVHLGKMPPSAVDLEECILGAILLEKAAIGLVRQFLQPDHFYLESNKLIYSACLESNPVDLMIVTSTLRKRGELELVGGAHHLATLSARMSSAANIQYHARVMIEFAIKRQLINVCSEVLTNVYDDTSDCFELLDFSETKIKEVRSWIR